MRKKLFCTLLLLALCLSVLGMSALAAAAPPEDGRDWELSEDFKISTKPFTVADGVTWTVKAGGSLQISNTVEIQSGGKLIIEAGGQVDILAGSLTVNGGQVEIQSGGVLNVGSAEKSGRLDVAAGGSLTVLGAALDGEGNGVKAGLMTVTGDVYCRGDIILYPGDEAVPDGDLDPIRALTEDNDPIRTLKYPYTGGQIWLKDGGSIVVDAAADRSGRLEIREGEIMPFDSNGFGNSGLGCLGGRLYQTGGELQVFGTLEIRGTAGGSGAPSGGRTAQGAVTIAQGSVTVTTSTAGTAQLIVDGEMGNVGLPETELSFVNKGGEVSVSGVLQFTGAKSTFKNGPAEFLDGDPGTIAVGSTGKLQVSGDASSQGGDAILENSGSITVAAGGEINLESYTEAFTTARGSWTVSGELTGNGTFTVLKHDLITGSGSITGGGSFICVEPVLTVPQGLVYDDGNVLQGVTMSEDTVTVLGCEFTVKYPAADWTLSYRWTGTGTGGDKTQVDVPGKYVYTFTYTGDDTGVSDITGSFTVEKKHITPTVTVGGGRDVPYGDSVAPVVTWNGRELAHRTDYTYSHSPTVEERAPVGAYTVTVTSLETSYYTFDPVQAEFRVVPAEVTVYISFTDNTGVMAGLRYTGQPIEPALNVRRSSPNGTVVMNTSDYVVTYTENTDVGTATVTVSPAQGGNYTFEEKTLTFEIFPRELSAGDITLLPTNPDYDGTTDTREHVYTGQVIMPAVTYGGVTLTPGVDYDAEYTSSPLPNMTVGVTAGTWELNITFKGNYTGAAITDVTVAKADHPVLGTAYSETMYVSSMLDGGNVTHYFGRVFSEFRSEEGTLRSAFNTPDTSKVRPFEESIDYIIVLVSEPAAGTTYTLTAVCASMNYNDIACELNVIGTNKSPETVTLSDVTKTFGDGPFTLNPAVDVDEEGGVWTFSVSGDAVTVDADGVVTVVKAGTAFITAKYESPSSVGQATAAVTVEKKSVSVPAADTAAYTYNGGEQTYGIPESEYYTVAGGTQTSANEDGYTVTVSLTDPVNTLWSDGSTEDKTYTFVIKKAAVTVTAVNISIYVGDDVPDLSDPAEGVHYTVTGLVGGDALGSVELSYSKNAAEVTPDSGAAGTYSIVISAAAAPNENYTVVKVPGTLTISSRTPFYTPPPEPAGGWDAIQDELTDMADGLESGAAEPGETLTVEMNGAVEVSGEVLEVIAGRDINVEFDMGGGAVWTVNGLDIPEGVADLDLGVTTGISNIPRNVYRELEGVSKTRFRLSHTGNFGTTLRLSLDLGEEYRGFWANLYYFNPVVDRLVFQSSVRISADGTAAWPFDHASSYAVVISTENLDPDYEEPFTDVEDGDWFSACVAWAHRNELVSGVTDVLFAPELSISRGEVVTALHLLEGCPEPTVTGVFSDDSSDAVLWAAENGIVEGWDGKFHGDEAITRQDLVTVLWRYAVYKGRDVSVGEDTNILSYADAFDVADYAMAPMQWACGEGIIVGKDGVLLAPNDAATRSETAAVLKRFLTGEETAD